MHVRLDIRSVCCGELGIVLVEARQQRLVGMQQLVCNIRGRPSSSQIYAGLALWRAATEHIPISSGWLICDISVITRTCISRVVMATACKKGAALVSTRGLRAGLHPLPHRLRHHTHTRRRLLGGSPGRVSATMSCITMTLFITTCSMQAGVRAGHHTSVSRPLNVDIGGRACSIPADCPSALPHPLH